MRRSRLVLALPAMVVLALGWAAPSSADEPGYRTDRVVHARPARPMRARPVVVRHRHGHDPIGYHGRGWGETTRVTHLGGQVVYEVYFPYVGRSYGYWPYRPRPVYTTEPAVSGLTAASLMTGLNDAYKMNRCYPPESIRHVGYFVVPVDRQQYYCRD